MRYVRLACKTSCVECAKALPIDDPRMHLLVHTAHDEHHDRVDQTRITSVLPHSHESGVWPGEEALHGHERVGQAVDWPGKLLEPTAINLEWRGVSILWRAELGEISQYVGVCAAE